MKRERERGGKTTSYPGSRCISDLGTMVPGSGGNRAHFLLGFHDISLHPYNEPSLISASDIIPIPCPMLCLSTYHIILQLFICCFPFLGFELL